MECSCGGGAFDGMYGGTCINIGCIPTKALVHYAQVTRGYRRPSTFEQYAEEFKRGDPRQGETDLFAS